MMHAIEYGKQNHDVVMLLHGGGLSWWSYRHAAELLQTTYHVVLPILDGHGENVRDFISIEQQARELLAYIDDHFQGKVFLLGGLSLGAQVAAEMLAQRGNVCSYAVLESALIEPMPITRCMVKPMLDCSYGLIQKRWFSKLQFWYLHIDPDLFEEYYADTCRISKENMIRFLQANASYAVKETLCSVQAKVYIFVGKKEQRRMIRSAKKLHSMIPNSVFACKENMRHGDFSINHPQEYTRLLMNLK